MHWRELHEQSWMPRPPRLHLLANIGAGVVANAINHLDRRGNLGSQVLQERDKLTLPHTPVALAVDPSRAGVASRSSLRLTRPPEMDSRARLSRQRFSQSAQQLRTVAAPGASVHTRKRYWLD